jgi:hypothetical protein
VQLNLLDYGNPKPFGETLDKPRHLAWPVDVYRVTLPRVSEHGDGLNPFERVILNLLDAGGARDRNSLEQETCIPRDLVQFVLLRLRDKAFIDEHHNIVEQRRNKWENNAEEPADFVTAVVFRELATGKLLPFLHRLDDDNPLKQKEDEKYSKHIIDGHKGNPPSPRDVITVLRAMQKRSSAFGEDTCLSVEHITIAQDPEQYALDCPIAIQKSDGEFRIADPFGNGYSLILEHAFNRLLEQDNSLSDWLMNWKQRLSTRKRERPSSEHKEPYNNSSNWGRYPKLLANLGLQSTGFRTIQTIHAAFEWAFFYACAQRPYDLVISHLRLTDQSEHPDLLAAAAKKIGLNPLEHGFRPVWGGKLDEFLAGKADLGTVLCIAILMAVNDDSYPLRRVAAKNQDFIIQLFDMKRKRDPQAHGKGKVNKGDIELPEESFMRDTVSSLLPSVVFSTTSPVEVDRDAVAELLLDARTSIQNEFGFGLFNRLGTDLQDRLIHAERFWLTCKDGDDALAFACDLYAAVQGAFRHKLSGVLPPDVGDSDFQDLAQKNASQAGLGKLPERLFSKPAAIQETLQGDDQSLGACVVAFLLVSNAEGLLSVAELQPPFLSDVETIVVRRGHGNEPLPLPKADILQLRRSSLSTVKTLLET